MSDAIRGVVRIVGGDGATAGAGFLASADGLILTCTHVAAVAAGAEGGPVRVEFLASNHGERIREAQVEAQFTRAVEEEDIACLRLVGNPPAEANPLVLGATTTSLGRTFRTFGFPAVKPVEGMAGEVHVTGRTTEGGFPVLQLRSNEVSLGFSGAPVWDDATGVVVGMVVSTVPAGADPAGKQSEVSFIRPAEELIAVCPLLRPEDTVPYRGLDVFEEEHARYYFGRDAAIAQLLEKLGQLDFVAVIGVSGSGKSSLVRAGLRKGFDRSQIPGLHGRPRCVVKPGRVPTLDLALALAALPEMSARVVAAALGVPSSLLEGASDARGTTGELYALRSPPDIAGSLRQLVEAPMILIVDQFERLFTECRDENQRTHFIDTLLAAAGDDVKVVITLRADFYGAALQHSGLGKAIDRGQLTLLPMEADEVRDAIVKPTQGLGRAFDAGLVERIAADATGNPGDLPLLEFALTELWERDAGSGLLKTDTYLELGYREADGTVVPGLHGAIARRAEDLWRDFDEVERAAARRVFLNLVTSAGEPGDGEDLASDASRRAWQSELGEAGRAVAAKLVDARLLTTGRDPYSNEPTVEVAHEALLGAWPRLKRWRAEHRPFIAWRDRDLVPFWRRWLDHERHSDFLLPPVMLEQARYWAREAADDLPGLSAEYIQASVDEWLRESAERERELKATRIRNRRLRILLGVLGVLTIASLVAMTWAARESRRADRERLVADARGLAAQSSAHLERRPDLAALLALEAWQRAPGVVEGRSAALAALSRTEGARMILRESLSTEVAPVVFSPDGRYLAAATAAEGRITLWDVRAGSAISPALSQADPNLVEFSGDGANLLAADGDGHVSWWKLDAGRPGRKRILGDTNASTIATTADGRTAAFGNFDGSITILDLRTGMRREIRAPTERAFGVSVGFVDEGRTLVSVDDDFVQSFDVATGVARGPAVVHDTGAFSVAYPPEGDVIALIPFEERHMVLWNARTGRRGAVIELGSEVLDASFAPVGNVLAVLDAEGSVGLWNLRSKPRKTHSLYGHSDAIGLDYSPDGQTVAIGGEAGTITLLNVDDPRALSDDVPGAGDDFARLSFASAEGDIVWLGNSSLGVFDSRARRWRYLERGEQFDALFGDLAIGGDGTAALLTDSLLVWRLSERPQPARKRDVSGSSVAVSPDGRTIAIGEGAGSGKVRIWDRQSGKQLGKAVARDSEVVWSVEFSPDGRLLASGGWNRRVSLWRVNAEGRRRWVSPLDPDVVLNHREPISEVAFAPSGELLAAAGQNGTIRIWRLEPQPHPVARLVAENWVRGIAFSPDSATLASADEDGTVRLWDVSSGRPLGIPLSGHSGYASAVSFRADGGLLASGGAGPAMVLWDSLLWSDDREAVSRHLCRIVARNLTRDEWNEFAPGRDYHRTCENRPAGA